MVSTYFSGPGEYIDGSRYPWGWQQPDYDDSAWKPVSTALTGAMKDTRNYRGRMLVPRPIPPMESTLQRFATIRIAEGAKVKQTFVAGKSPITIAPHRRARIILDQDSLTTGYLTLIYSQGRGSRLTVGYTEAYYDVDSKEQRRERMPKGDRSKIDGKQFFGTEDIILPDGGTNRQYTSLWWRTWRYVEILVETADEPLVLNDAKSEFSAYPFKPAFTLKAPGHPELARMLQIGWRTARLCANETYMDCPYYEQMQYWGDTRIQALITMFNTHDTLLVRNALEQGRQSIVADGITKSRYPSDRRQFISSFSLLWVCMGHDYWMYRGDEAYLKTLLPAWRGVLAWYEQWLKEDGSLSRVPHWYFADWVKSFPNGGEPIRERDGNSAFQDLLYLMTLDYVAQMEHDFGIPSMGDHYAKVAQKIRSYFREKYWDEAMQLFADTHDHRSFSQHVNALAVLTHIVEGKEAQQLVHRMLKPDREGQKHVARATIYFRYYVNRALAEAGLGDELLDHMQPWTDQMALNLTTWAETPEPSRSDCHAWSASPNIEIYRTMLGIDAASPAFSHVSIRPALGTIRQISGSMPHPRGTISVGYKVNKHGSLHTTISLPKGIPATLYWHGKTYNLQGTGQPSTIVCE